MNAKHQTGNITRSTAEFRINDGGFAIALSGGGHRATLATLGALTAIVDRGLGPKVLQIASVSGGSVTNAFVAYRRHFEELKDVGQLDDVAAELTSVIIKKGVLTKFWITLVFLAPIALGVGAACTTRSFFAAWDTSFCFVAWGITCCFDLSFWISAVVFLIVTLPLLLARGLVVDWLIDRRYFRPYPCRNGKKTEGRVRFKSLLGSKVDHVFCMTDLALGLPVYASTQQNRGMMYRRLELQIPLPPYKPAIQSFNADQFSLAELVRASAAFPGIPPRRMLIPEDGTVGLLAQEAFLADGGIWNNLATQALREDSFYGTLAEWDGDVPRPYPLDFQEDIPQLCFNASAQHKPKEACSFKIPGYALYTCLRQTMEVLNTNTVLPRVDAMRKARLRRSSERSSSQGQIDLIVDLRPCDEIEDDYCRDLRSPEDTSASASAMSPGKQPQSSRSVRGLASVDDWYALKDLPVWRELVGKYGTDQISVDTTLAAIDAGTAERLIMRGYLNTYLVSLFIKPLEDNELVHLKKLQDRIDKIVGKKPDG